MEMIGADVAQLRELVHFLAQAEVQLSNLRGRIDARITTPAWQGPDAQRFRNEWRAQHRSSLVGAVSALGDMAERLDHDATEQEAASRGSSSSGAPVYDPNGFTKLLEDSRERFAGPIGILSLAGAAFGLSDAKYQTGRYRKKPWNVALKTKRYNSILRAHEVIRKDPMFKAIAGNKMLRAVMDNPVARKFNPVMGFYQVGDDIKKFDEAKGLGAKVDAGFHVAESSLKASKVGYLPGVALSAVHMVWDVRNESSLTTLFTKKIPAIF